MAPRADIWAKRKRRGGPIDSYYFRKTRLRTKDPTEARRRVKLLEAGKWPPIEERAARVSTDAFAAGSGDAASSDAGPDDGSNPSVSPDPAPSGDWTADATAAAHEATGNTAPGGAAPVGGPVGPTPEQAAQNQQYAELAVGAQLKVAELYAQKKVWPGFVAPSPAPAGRQMLVSQWRALFDYAGTLGIVLPPWVSGALIPAITIVVSSVAIAQGFAAEAAMQRAAAEASGAKVA